MTERERRSRHCLLLLDRIHEREQWLAFWTEVLEAAR